jgi:tRNA threonylcarbamoyladenosine biosynthesis protein TsaB
MKSRRLLLSLETATRAGSIAILKDSNVLASSGGDPEVSHSNTLLADTDILLSNVNLTIRDIDIFAVATGPGSFTGLRIGISTVKALAETLHRPGVGVPTLEAIAHSAGPSDATVALLPAGRGELFVQLFSTSSEGAVTALDQPAHLSPTQIIEKYRTLGNICWVGEGADLYAGLIRESAIQKGYQFTEAAGTEESTDGWRTVKPTSNLAQHVASLALSRLQVMDARPNDLRAIYVRPSDAELKL